METSTQTKPKAINLNKPCYTLFTLAAVIFILTHDFSQAATFAGLALAFDPFDPQMPFQQRPLYQKAWPIVHLAIAVALFVLMLIK